MKPSQTLRTSLRNEAIGFGLIQAAWSTAALFYPPYIIPAPWEVLNLLSAGLPENFGAHLLVTLWRTGTGFGLALLGGTLFGLWTYSRQWTAQANALLIALQVLPGTVLGVILLLVVGIGSTAPILLIAALTLPTVAINTLNGLSKKNLALEQYLQSIGSRRSMVLRSIYLPALVPVLQSNLSLGFSLAVKVVVLGEFIGAQNGLGYLLNRARITFDMQEVFFYLMVLLTFTLVFQAAQSLFFSLFLQKYFYPE
jgi:NitT/TauT family transport system permease protein